MTEKRRETRTRPIAMLLSFLSPGLGQAYAGHSLRGVVWAASPVLVIVSVSLLVSELSAKLLWCIAGALFALWIASIVDAAMLKPTAYRAYSLVAVILIAAGTVFLTPMIAVGIRVFVLEAFKTPSGSMIPTVEQGDHFFVDKMIFRSRVPKRGELAVFPFPEHPDQDFVKRVIGLPGDRIEFHGGHPSIDGWEIPHCPVGQWSYTDPIDQSVHDGVLEVEFVDDAAYLTFFETQYATDYQGPWVVKADEVFVVGDNRNNSHDSRLWMAGVGAGVPIRTLKGKPRFVWATAHGLTWRDMNVDPPAPSSATQAATEQCLAQRPPREKTSPTSPPKH